MKRIEAMLANAKAIESHAKVLWAKGSRALAKAYFARADQLRADAATLDRPLALAA